MALITKAAFITAIDNAAAGLTAAWKDSLTTQVAEVIRHPMHPLRRTEKLFKFNAKTGVVTTDEDYIDAAFDRGFGAAKGNAFSKITDFALTLLSATVEDAAPANIVLTFSRSVTAAEISNILPAKTISGISINGAVVTVTVSVPFANGDVISCSGSFSSGLSNLILDAESVTNNVAL